MKAIRMRIEKSSRWVAVVLASVVAIITSSVVANATQTITTPNAVKITYNLMANTNSAPMTPATNTSVLVMGCCTTLGAQGAAQVSLLHLPSTIIHWAGYESYAPVAFTGGDDNVAGAHIVYIDANHQVQIQTAGADTILVHNAAAATRAGSVTLIW